ncbi:MAG: hypothetical protein ACE5HO_14535 [bacterium]
MNSAREKFDWIDGSYYPEQPVPDNITGLPEKVDFLIRLCAAWDFGLPPASNTFEEILRDDWKIAVDEAQLLTSCAYHLLRELHHLEPLPYLGTPFPDILNDPYLEYV